jgi:hypothetical protein
MKRSLLNIAFVVLGMMLTASLSVFTAQQVIRTPKQTPYPKNPDWAKQELDVLKVQGQVYLIAGAGGNIAAQVGDECVLLVDTGYAQMAPKVVAEIRKLSKQPLRTIINTTLMESHTGANGLLVKEGRQIDNTGPGLGGRPNEADLTASASLLALMTEIGARQDSRRPLAAEHVSRQAEGSVFQRRTRRHSASARRDGRGQHRLVPEVRRRRDRRSHEHGQLPLYRCCPRRQH